MSPVAGVAFAPHPPIIIPEVGKGKEREAGNTIKGMEKLVEAIVNKSPDTLVVLTPHSQYNGIMTIATNQKWRGSLLQFGCPDVEIQINNNTELVNIINEQVGLSRADMPLDHGALVPLYFIWKHLKDFKIVLIGVGPHDSEALISISNSLGMLLQEQNENIILLASGDLSHRLRHDGPYGKHPSGPIFDELVVKAFKEKNLDQLKNISTDLRNEAAECGLNPFIAASEMVKPMRCNIELCSYEGPFGVGYLTAFADCNIVEKHQYVRVAEEAIKKYVTEGETINPEEYFEEIFDEKWLRDKRHRKAGSFVSIHKNGRLRGCIGTIMPAYDNILQEVNANAIAAATKDPRFSPVEEEELKDISIKVDILGDMEEIETVEVLNPKEYGIMVESKYKRGVLLPDLEGVDTAIQQFEIAKEKAGIGTNEKIRIYRFQVERFA
ncbi:MAG: AmmeMemoRadiSam system protein A [Tindallia sp. MSAO_Bac2]|nr:MAG: AmmeMemoRadiSam system protein A [Tindallia sp. MSAO_Bac2]